MDEWILIDGNQVVELGTSPADVEFKLLDLLRSRKLSSPDAIVDVGSPHEATLAVGISGAKAYAEFGMKDGDPPYYVAVDPSVDKGSGSVAFSYKGERTWIPSRNCVSIEELTRIVKHFIATESIPEWITTEEV